MKTLSRLMLTKILRWKIVGDFPDLKRSIIIFAPHTSYFDGLYGKLYLMHCGIRHKFLSKEEFFRFPMKYLFYAFGSIPVFRNKKYIDQIITLMNTNEMHIIVSPEGQLTKTTHWKKGYFYMAKGANVPIVVGYLDYKRKEIGIRKVIYDLSDMQQVMQEIAKLYSTVTAKHPDCFSVDNSLLNCI